MSRSSRIDTLARTLADRFSQDIYNREQFLPTFSFDLPIAVEKYDLYGNNLADDATPGRRIPEWRQGAVRAGEVWACVSKAMPDVRCTCANADCRGS